jgi:tetratricopeptide (TPR) repeat protein
MCQKYLYDNLDEVERVYLHKDVGESLEKIYLDHPEEISMLVPQLARHFQEAGIIEKSINYEQRAGENAIKLSAYQEAHAHLSRALEMLLLQPESDKRKKQELDLQISLGMAWIGIEGNGCPEVGKIFSQARQLCNEVGTTTQMCQILAELSIIHYVTSEYKKSSEVSVEIINLADTAGDPIVKIMGIWLLSLPMFCRGEFIELRNQLAKVIEFYKPDQHHERLLSLRGSDAGVSALAYDACTLWLLGYPEQAEAQSNKALSISRQLDHPFTRADVLCYAGCIYNSMRQEPQAELLYAQELEELSLKKVQSWRGIGTGFIGEVLGMMEEYKKGIRLLRESLAVRNSTNILLCSSALLCSLAKNLAVAGQIGEGLKTLEKAFDFIERTDERFWEAELQRVKAEILGMKGDDTGAEASLMSAITIARRQQAKSWELRATTDISRLWISQGKIEQARSALEGIYGWFTEGFETPDLRDAAVLLEELK